MRNDNPELLPVETATKPAFKARVLAKTSFFLGGASFLCFITLFRLVRLPPSFLSNLRPIFILLGAWVCTAVAAVGIGYCARYLICADPGQRASGWARAGFYLGCTSLTLILVADQVFAKARLTDPPINPCLNNLRRLNWATEQWALDNKKTVTEKPNWDDLVGTNKYIENMPPCPLGGRYFLGSQSVRPFCPYHLFVVGDIRMEGAHYGKRFGSWRAMPNPLTCQQSLNVLRLIKQQYPEGLSVVEAHLQQSYPNSPYIRCEAGGRFIIGTSNEAPKCSIPGHTLSYEK